MSLNIRSFVSGPLETNVYLLEDTASREAVIVDPSFENPQVTQAAQEMVAAGATFKAIWLTHAHLDHWHNSGYWQDEYDLPAYLHENERAWTEDPAEQALWMGLPEPNAAKITDWIEDGQELKLGEYRFRAILLPGHSPGSVAFYCEQEKLIIVGDVLFAGSAGRTDMLGGDATALRESLRKLMQLPPETKVLPGHRGATTIGAEKKTNPFCHGL